MLLHISARLQMGRLTKVLGSSKIVKERLVNSSLLLSLSSSNRMLTTSLAQQQDSVLQEFYLDIANNRVDSALKLYNQLIVEPRNCKKKKEIYSAALINILDGAIHLSVAEGNKSLIINKYNNHYYIIYYILKE